jgi:hypothetical protein
MNLHINDVAFIIAIAFIFGIAFGIFFLNTNYNVETIALCNDTHCVDNYRVTCNYIHDDLPTGYTARRR